MADVALPPPAQHQNAGFPSDQALQRRGYDPKTGIWKVDVQNNGKPTVTKNGGNINGSQGKNVTVTGRYGETGTMNTTVSQNVNVGKVETILGGTLAGATVAGGAIGSDYAAWTYRDIKDGDWAEGSSTPQQTRFRMNQDGTVGVDYVPRPDLKPNSPEAPNKPEKTTPSRQESPDTPNAPNSPNSPNTPNEPNSQNKQNQNDKEKDFCQKNPNSDQCILGGKSEDIKLPEQTIDLNFKPENIFQTDGVCPQPQSVDLGAFGRVEFSYQPLCDFAAKLRPVLIMMTILTCAWFVYGALQDL